MRGNPQLEENGYKWKLRIPHTSKRSPPRGGSGSHRQPDWLVIEAIVTAVGGGGGSMRSSPRCGSGSHRQTSWLIEAVVTAVGGGCGSMRSSPLGLRSSPRCGSGGHRLICMCVFCFSSMSHRDALDALLSHYADNAQARCTASRSRKQLAKRRERINRDLFRNQWQAKAEQLPPYFFLFGLRVSSPFSTERIDLAYALRQSTGSGSFALIASRH